MKTLIFMFLIMTVIGLGCSDDATGGTNKNCNPKCEDWQSCGEDNTCVLKADHCEKNEDCKDASKSVCNDKHECVAGNSDLCGDVKCGDNEQCVNEQCACKDGFKRDNNGTCMANSGDACKNVTCGDNESCVNGDCLCSEGFHKENNKCIANPADPCKNVVCPDNTVCKPLGNDSNGYDCACEAPFILDAQGNCIPAGCENTVCKTNEICEMDDNSPKCVCKTGYRADDSGACVADCSNQVCDPNDFHPYCDTENNKIMNTCRADDRGCGIEVIGSECSNGDTCIIKDDIARCEPKSCQDECQPSDAGHCLDSKKVIEQCNYNRQTGCYEALASNCGDNKFCDINGTNQCENLPDNCQNLPDSCSDEGKAVCSDDNSAINTCTRNSDHCLVWVKTSCGDNKVCQIDSNSNQPVCVNGNNNCGPDSCDPTGINSKCGDNNIVIQCLPDDNNPQCSYWKEQDHCEDSGLVCVEQDGVAQCLPDGNCHDECIEDTTKCSDDGLKVMVCNKIDTCFKWVVSEDCATDGRRCELGVGIGGGVAECTMNCGENSCNPETDTAVCEGDTVVQCLPDNDNPQCSYWTEQENCSDSDMDCVEMDNNAMCLPRD